jgi:serine/threonine protein phosphatase PrpC
MRIRGWGLSDVGRRRAHNEDRFICNDRLALYAVADGMGGHLGGERASRMAIEILEAKLASAFAVPPPPGGPDAPPLTADEALRAAIAEADRRIYELSSTDPEVAGMGTTLTALLFRDRRAYLGHVGDSRAYLFRDGHARQLTEDHSWIQEQVRAGLLTPNEAKESRFRNIITRSVGFEPLVTPDLQDLHPQAGDCFVLCSDGLSNYVPVEEIGQVLTTDFYRDAPRSLIALANERGGDDNVTCICVHVANDAG